MEEKVGGGPKQVNYNGDVVPLVGRRRSDGTRAAVAIHLPRYRGKCRPAQRVGTTSTSDLPRPRF